MTKNKVIKSVATGAMILLFLGIVIMSATQKVSGQYEVGGTFMPVDPTAPGTKLFVTLTIHFLPVPTSIYPCGARKPIAVPQDYWEHGYAAGPYFMRIQKGNGLYAFSSNISDTETELNTLSRALCTGNFSGAKIVAWDDVLAQEQAITEFFTTRVIPELFPNNTSAPFALKSYSLFKQGGDEFFTVLDMVIAVQE